MNLKARFQQSEKLLPAIEKLLKKKKNSLKKIKGIIVVSGPGGFTSLRIGLATANTIGYAHKISVVGVKLPEGDNCNCRLQEGMIKEGIKLLKKAKKFKVVMPFYGQEPNITITNKN